MTHPKELVWCKGTHSDGGNGNCVEVAMPGDVAVRDSKAPADGHLDLSPTTWRASLETVNGMA